MKNGALIAIGVAALIVAAGAAYLVRGMAPTPSAIESGRAYSAAHDTMMAAMAGSGVAWRGNPDADFAMLMIPHHQGAVDMAKVELKYGTDPKVRGLATRIAAAQQPEIDLMSRWRAGHPQPSAVPEGSAARQAYTAANDTMMNGMMGSSMAHSGNADRDFVDGMIPHHQGAIDMAAIETRYGNDPDLKSLAEKIVAAQRAEITEMGAWLKGQGK